MNFFSPEFRPIEKTNTHNINSVILKLNTNLKKPVSKYLEMKIEINKHLRNEMAASQWLYGEDQAVCSNDSK